MLCAERVLSLTSCLELKILAEPLNSAILFSLLSRTHILQQSTENCLKQLFSICHFLYTRRSCGVVPPSSTL